MKNNFLKIALAGTSLLFNQYKMQAQTINWEQITQKQNHLLHTNFGIEYGINTGIGYHQLFSIKQLPILVGGEFSKPFGSQFADDCKLRIGAQIRLLKIDHFQLSARIQGIARRNENTQVRLYNFGSDLSGTLGYYRKHWFLGTEVGFDKAIVTNFKHSDWYKQNIYDDVQDGWYEPTTGGNFYYGAILGFSFKKIDITLNAGKILQQDFKSTPTLPIYGKLGVIVRF